MCDQTVEINTVCFHYQTFGDGSMLKIAGVSENDAGVYQCTGRNRFGQNYTDHFELNIVPGKCSYSSFF